MGDRLLDRMGVERLPARLQVERSLPNNFKQQIAEAKLIGSQIVPELCAMVNLKTFSSTIEGCGEALRIMSANDLGVEKALRAVCFRRAITDLRGTQLPGKLYPILLSKAQRSLMLALLYLPVGGRLLLRDTFGRNQRERRKWNMSFIGAVSEGRLFFALNELGKNPFVSGYNLDIYDKIDGLVLRKRGPILTFQVKTGKRNMVILQPSAPGNGDRRRHGRVMFQKTLWPLWRRSRAFNNKFHVNSVPVAVFVKRRGSSVGSYRDPELSRGVAEIFRRG